MSQSASVLQGRPAVPQICYKENVDRIRREFPAWVYQNLLDKIASGEIIVVELRQ